MPLTDDSWRATLAVWSLPALIVAMALTIPRRDYGEKAQALNGSRNCAIR